MYLTVTLRSGPRLVVDKESRVSDVARHPREFAAVCAINVLQKTRWRIMPSDRARLLDRVLP